MNAEQIFSKIQKRLDLHLNGHLGHIGQAGYKDDLFRLFEHAYDAGYCDVGGDSLLTGDAIRDVLEVRWIAGLDAKLEQPARDLMERFLCMWDEWRYALDKRQV